MFIDVSLNLKKLASFFPEGLFVVGGYVRNQLLKIESSDVDLASPVDIEEVSKRLENTDYVVKVKNLKTGSLLISKGGEKYEYTAFRRDVYNSGGAHAPTRIERTSNIRDDAERRDFTINSIYYNINTDEIVDYYHGIIDLNDKIIRCNINPEEVLKYDGERVLRMVRIAGELDFNIDKETFKAAKNNVTNLLELSGVRKFTELEKILYCDKRYNLNQGSLKNALSLLNALGVWEQFGLKKQKIVYKYVYRVEDRFLGLLIDVVNAEKPECLQDFVEKLLIDQFAMNEALAEKMFIYLAGFYDAIAKMSNKDFFIKYFEDWANIYPLLGARSKRLQAKYTFFYKYIIEHGLAIQIADLKIDASDIRRNFPKIDKRLYQRILTNLLSKVFDGKVENEKENLLKEIENNTKID